MRSRPLVIPRSNRVSIRIRGRLIPDRIHPLVQVLGLEERLGPRPPKVPRQLLVLFIPSVNISLSPNQPEEKKNSPKNHSTQVRFATPSSLPLFPPRKTTYATLSPNANSLPNSLNPNSGFVLRLSLILPALASAAIATSTSPPGPQYPLVSSNTL